MISDFDGTITRSDVIGFFSGKLYDCYHEDVFKLMHKLEEKNIHVIYLSMRSI